MSSQRRTYAERKAIGIVRLSVDLKAAEQATLKKLSKLYGITRTQSIIKFLDFVELCWAAQDKGQPLPSSALLLKSFSNTDYARKLTPNELAKPHGRRASVRKVGAWPT